MHTSLNYLSTMVLDKAGLPLTPYHKFLEDLQTKVPAMNSRGFYSTQDGEYKHYVDATGEEKEMLDQYQILQYNDMFDKKNRSDVFFSYQGANKKE